MDVDNEVEPTLQEMAKRMAVLRSDLLPALRQLDEDTILSYYSVEEQARLYLSAAFTLALSLYALDKITHRQVPAGSGGAVAPRLTGAGTRHSGAAPVVPANTDTQLVLKIERITEYIKKLQELATLERGKKLAVAAAAASEEAEPATGVVAAGKKRPRELRSTATASADSAPETMTLTTTAAKKAKSEAGADGTAADTPGKAEEVVAEDEYGDAQMFSVVSRVAGETGALVGRLLKHVMSSKNE